MPRPLDPARVLRRRAQVARLDRSASTLPEVAAALVALHGSDPATVHLSLLARLPEQPLAAILAAFRAAVDEDRALLRIMGMRRTVHVVPRELAPAVFALALARVNGDAQKLAHKQIAAGGTEPLDALRAAVLLALGDEALTTEELFARVPALSTRIALAEGKPYAGEAPVGRAVIEALGTEGTVVRASTVGGWKQGKCRWARRDRWAPEVASMPYPTACATLARAWATAFGPGTRDDLAWWAGIPKSDASKALTAIEAREVEVRGWPGARVVLAGQDWEADAPGGVALLPSIDPSAMCWTERGPFLDPAHAAPLWDRSGNLGPSIWVDGRIVGGWACRKEGAVVSRLLDPSGQGVEAEIAAECARLTRALEGEVIAPRFPPPLTKELTAGPLPSRQETEAGD